MHPSPIVWIDDGVGPLGEPRAHVFQIGDVFAMAAQIRPTVAKAMRGDAKARQELDAITSHANHPASPLRGQCILLSAIVAEVAREIDAKPVVEAPQPEVAPAAPAPKPATLCHRSALPETDPLYHPEDFPCEECEAKLREHQLARRAAAEAARAAKQPHANGGA